MRRTTVISKLVPAAVAGWVTAAVLAGGGDGSYRVTATAIEACSCPLFCSCYYNTEPAGSHMCRFNNAYRFEPGSHWGGVDLSGAKLWVSGDLGGHFGDGTTEWAVVTFDRATTPAQRAAIEAWMAKVFPVQWGEVQVKEDEISWQDGEETAHAKLASGLAEITLAKVFDASGQQAMVLHTPYWGSDSNTGFRLAHSTHYYGGEPSYRYERRNGFVITFTTEGELPREGGE